MDQIKSVNLVNFDYIPSVFCIVAVIYWIVIWYKFNTINNAINNLDIQQFRAKLNEMKILGIVLPLLYIIALGFSYSSTDKKNIVFSQVMMWLTFLMFGFGIGIWWISSKIVNDCVEGICDYEFAKSITNYLYTILGCGLITNFMAVIYFYFFNEIMKKQINLYLSSLSEFVSNFRK